MSFKCQECGKKFSTNAAARRAMSAGCPKCGGVDIDLPLVPAYRPRFVSEAQLADLVNLWHLARTALAGTNPDSAARARWASDQFARANPTVTSTAAYKDLSGPLEGQPYAR